MSSVIILGDPHCGKNLSQGKIGAGATLNSRIVDQFNLLEWTLDQALEHSAEHIIITGDVFEEPKPSTAIITLFLAWLKKCQAYQVHVHIIMGNHDFLRTGYVYTSPLDIVSEVDLEYVSIYRDINTILIGSTAFTLVPFKDRKSFGSKVNAEAVDILKESIVYELAGIPVTYKKILVGHLAIEGSIPVGDEIDDISNELFCPLSMFNGYDYVWMGHVHKPQVMQKNNPYIAHIGSMDISNFGETDHKKQIVIIDCNDKEANFGTVVLPTRPLVKVNITVPKDTDDTTKYVLDEISKSSTNFNKAIVRVEIVLSAPELKSVKKSAIEHLLLQKGAFNIIGISESKKVSLIKKDTSHNISTKIDVTPAIKIYADLYVDAKFKDRFIDLANEIYMTYKEESKE